ncbi:MAG: site-2 protease family protein [Actinobacteria bacterium]|nr:site-2 protease family protein [Actinomycetota bacterium]
MSIAVSILGLGFLILIHEAGHFFVARAVGMNPRKFYLGFPPALVKTKRNGIEYGVGAIPLGGYVKIPGMHRPAPGDIDVHFGRAVAENPSLLRPVEELRRRLDDGDYAGARDAVALLAARIGETSLSPVALKTAERGLVDVDDALAPDAYWRAKTWKRVAVIFAGPAANLVLAVAVFAALFVLLSGSYRLGFELRGTTDNVTATINRVLVDTPAAEAGVRAGDRVVAINGKPVDGDSIRSTIQASEGKPLRLTVERGGETVQLLPVRPEKSEEFGPLEAVGESFRVTWVVTKEIGKSVGRLVTGDGREEISSPVGIVQGSSEAVEQGTDSYLWVLGLISLSLALLNLLPLLPLDGGHIAFSLLEGIRGKAVAREVYERVSVVGIAVVLLLFFIGLSNDIGRLGN